jgi:hypothetical protein
MVIASNGFAVYRVRIDSSTLSEFSVKFAMGGK